MRRSIFGALNPPVTHQKPFLADHLFRTEEDLIFLDQFEQIFLAASEGNLATCKYLVRNGFSDLHAVSYGRFGSTLEDSLDGISPLKIAEIKKHDHITRYFQKCLAKTEAKKESHVPEEKKLDSIPSAQAHFESVNVGSCDPSAAAAPSSVDLELLIAERKKLMEQYNELKQKTLDLYRK